MSRTSFIQTTALMLVGISLLVGCTRPAAIRERNRDNLSRLSIDMNRKEVLRIMRKPYRTELMRMSKGETVELLLYYTDLKAADNAITDDELTPVVLMDDKVVGWGWMLLRRYRTEQQLQPGGQPQGGVQDIREQVGSGDPMY
ncbi:MAG: hypothetical protein CL923_06715 [Deltaproteobacteria bacterium]|jgi:hypothetical protein|nr:hypothetical protein [Deltaproteobacteria bacterium]MDP7158719.1 DUF3192 domain-containing protein [SAR324 cluster bacterium]MDP7317659.1 DUF3192 domain-containing protein [SAR324 cluster bacterium]MDP7463472.1 DUF3192 domain-containing protein [SAR324 cluster bacterium]MDP7631221.1 DUF3192 domain-containing protein [SAR324 cluster bacterium]|tara:strand:- start:78 stop:506 length:429 start_codon:yes stop_codon:yes gene_type:complete